MSLAIGNNMHCGLNMVHRITYKVSVITKITRITRIIIILLIERALGYDERPLRISQKLKDAKQNPVFVLKNVKDNKPFTPPTSYTNPRAPTAHHQQDTKSSKTSNNNNNNITSGRVGYEVVVPVISSSISSPTASTPTVTHHSNGSTSSLSTNNKKNSNSGSSSNNNNSNKLTATTPTIEYNNELGLDNAIVNAIFTINNSP